MTVRVFLGVAAAWLGAQAAQAQCTVSSDAGAARRALPMNSQASAQAVISMSMTPKLMHVSYASLTAKRPACDLGAVDVRGAAYELYGDDASGRQREALPTRSGDPVAVILPVVDILKALDASKQGKAAATDGYLLATVSPSDLTGWRYYSGMPDPAVLRADMAQALAGNGQPIFRNGPYGKTSIFVPKS